jgi:hypothetical protein
VVWVDIADGFNTLEANGEGDIVVAVLGTFESLLEDYVAVL